MEIQYQYDTFQIHVKLNQIFFLTTLYNNRIAILTKIYDSNFLKFDSNYLKDN